MEKIIHNARPSCAASSRRGAAKADASGRRQLVAALDHRRLAAPVCRVGSSRRPVNPGHCRSTGRGQSSLVKVNKRLCLLGALCVRLMLVKNPAFRFWGIISLLFPRFSAFRLLSFKRGASRYLRVLCAILMDQLNKVKQGKSSHRKSKIKNVPPPKTSKKKTRENPGKSTEIKAIKVN